MNAIRLIWESPLQEPRRVIGHGNDYARFTDKPIKANGKSSRRKNVVPVRRKTESDWKKFVDPEGSARGHSSKMCMNMSNPHLLQAQPDVNSLIEPKKIGAPPPLIQSTDNFRSQFSFFGRATNLFEQLFLLRQTLHALNYAGVPVLRRFIFRIANGKNRWSDALSR